MQQLPQLFQISDTLDAKLTNTLPDTEPKTKLSLQQIAALPLEERHTLLAESIALTSEDFLTNPELIEFSVLDVEDWDTNND